MDYETDMEILLGEYTDADKNGRETLHADADQKLRFWNEALQSMKQIDEED